MLEIRQLRYVQAVAEELHFGRAAARLHIAQPALSRQIQKIEGQTGAVLFSRTQRKVELTAAGRLMFERASAILSELQQLEIDVRRAGRGEIGRLTVGFIHSSTYGLLPRTLQRFRDLHPDVELDLREMGIADQVAALAQDKIDVGLSRPARYAPGVQTCTIMEEDFVVAVPAYHALASSSSTPLARLANEPFILFPRSSSPLFNTSILTMCDQAGFTPQAIQTATQVHTVVGLVSAGMGIAIVPATAKNMQVSGVAFLRIEEDPPPVKIVLAWRPTRDTPALLAFREIAMHVSKEFMEAQAKTRPRSIRA
jgi:DNA-binding transcriptional LysR family regulator